MRLMRPVVGVMGLSLVMAACVALPREHEPEPEGVEPRTVSTAQVCGGTLFSPEAGRALEKVMEGTAFVIREPEDDRGAADIAQAVENAYRAGVDIENMPNGTCRIRGVQKERGGRIPKASMTFIARSKHAGPADLVGAEGTGVRVDRGITDHSVVFDCVSSRVGSTADAPVRITARFDGRSAGEYRKDPSRADDYLTLVHSAARSVAAELGCRDDGGLPAQFKDLERYVDAP
ncbi:hypothetical protein ACFY7H_23330 [Streptomyces sp. NPDC012794]|uniref:hypothetical protein n=1 Tax=Streptomyces sp. NPDC012794 TaxID=3364850 RepID=UPI0036BBE887